MVIKFQELSGKHAQVTENICKIVRSCLNFVHENIYADVLDDFFGTTRAHRGSYVTEEYRKKRRNRP